MRSLVKFIFFLIKLPHFILQLIKFSKMNLKILSMVRLMPKLFDNKNKEPFDHHYLYHTAWATRILKKINPKMHYDFASDLRFITQISSFIKTTQYNLGIPTIKLDGLEFKSTDLTNMNNIESSSLDSISCMHVIEHVGLGRYGDPIKQNGDWLAIKEIKRVLANNGNLLFVTPVGKKKIYFNAHRVYSYDDILEFFSDFKLEEFSLIEDDGFEKGIIKNPNPSIVKNNNYACGCFWFKKI